MRNVEHKNALEKDMNEMKCYQFEMFGWSFWQVKTMKVSWMQDSWSLFCQDHALEDRDTISLNISMYNDVLLLVIEYISL